MKKLIPLFLILLATCAKAQNNASDFKTAILVLEAKRIHSVYKESTMHNGAMLIGKDVLINDITPEIKERAMVVGDLTQEEADELFGKNNNLFNFKGSDSKVWSQKDFPNFPIDIFDDTDKRPERRLLKISNFITALSAPILRDDDKYAMIKVTNEHEGTYLSVYKKSGNEWVHHKFIYLSL